MTLTLLQVPRDVALRYVEQAPTRDDALTGLFNFVVESRYDGGGIVEIQVPSALRLAGGTPLDAGEPITCAFFSAEELASLQAELGKHGAASTDVMKLITAALDQGDAIVAGVEA